MLAGEFEYRLEKISFGQHLILLAEELGSKYLTDIYTFLTNHPTPRFEDIKTFSTSIIQNTENRPDLIQGLHFRLKQRIDLWNDVRFDKEPYIFRLLFSIFKEGYAFSKQKVLFFHLCLNHSLQDIECLFEIGPNDSGRYVHEFLLQKRELRYPFVFPDGKYLEELTAELSVFMDAVFAEIEASSNMGKAEKEEQCFNLIYLLEHLLESNQPAFDIFKDMLAYFLFRLSKIDQLLDDQGNLALWYVNNRIQVRIDYYQRAVSYLVEINEKDRLSNFKLMAGIEAVEGAVEHKEIQLFDLYKMLVLIAPSQYNQMKKAYYKGLVVSEELGINDLIERGAKDASNHTKLELALAALYFQMGMNDLAKTKWIQILPQVKNQFEKVLIQEKLSF